MANTTGDGKPDFMPFTKYSQNRWLVQGKVAQKIVDIWPVLVKYFKDVSNQLSGKQKFKALLILENLNEKNYAYFVFVTPIIEYLKKLTSSFKKKRQIQ